MMDNVSVRRAEGVPETVMPRNSVIAAVEVLEGGKQRIDKKKKQKTWCSFPETLLKCWETSISDEQCGIILVVLLSLFGCSCFLSALWQFEWSQLFPIFPSLLFKYPLWKGGQEDAKGEMASFIQQIVFIQQMVHKSICFVVFVWGAGKGRQ